MSDATPPTGRSMTGKTVIVTGGNSGIGKATAAALARAGARVVITARDQARGNQAVDDIRQASGSDLVELVVFDLGTWRRSGPVPPSSSTLPPDRRADQQCRSGAHRPGRDRRRVRGHVCHQPSGSVPADRTAHRPAGGLGSVPGGQRGVHCPPVGATGLDFEDLQARQGYKGMQVYGSSKLANILFTTELASRLSGKGVTANSVHPGTVATGYGRDGDTHGFLAFGLKVIKPFVLTPEKGAKTSVYLASSEDVAGVTGKYFVKCKARKPSAAAQDEAAARRLWAVSEELVGVAKS